MSTPICSALMCDGMGWFTATDLKRALLLFDRLDYLIPEKSAEFEDVDGRRRWMLYPQRLHELPTVRIQHYVPDRAALDLIAAVAQSDVADPAFVSWVQAIPSSDRRYTWQATNADGDLGSGSSLGLRPADEALAHAYLLNKLLLAADSLGCVPISGRPFIHPLIASKYERTRRLLDNADERSANPLSSALSAKLHPVAVGVVNAFVSDAELAERSELDIIEYRDRHRELFAAFSAEMLELAATLQGVPGTPEFNDALHDMLVTKLWKRRADLRDELRSAWNSFFKTSGRAVTAGVLGLGVAPMLPLGSLVAAAAAASAGWLVPDLIDLFGKYRKVRAHGLYYIAGFVKG